ncbi:hypothetical protein FACS189481_6100 [Clostridia bacterium]|nr:hypothetical protein FACS189481_6100 [Clostridia bacterium]
MSMCCIKRPSSLRREVAGGVAKEKALKPKNGFKKWFSETRSELKKVSWPTRKQVINGTNIVFLMIAAFGVLVWSFDAVLMQLLNFVLDNAVS